VQRVIPERALGARETTRMFNFLLTTLMAQTWKSNVRMSYHPVLEQRHTLVSPDMTAAMFMAPRVWLSSPAYPSCECGW